MCLGGRLLPARAFRARHGRLDQVAERHARFHEHFSLDGKTAGCGRQEGGFSRAVWPDEPDALARSQTKVHTYHEIAVPARDENILHQQLSAPCLAIRRVSVCAEFSDFLPLVCLLHGPSHGEGEGQRLRSPSWKRPDKSTPANTGRAQAQRAQGWDGEGSRLRHKEHREAHGEHSSSPHSLYGRPLGHRGAPRDITFSVNYSERVNTERFS